MYNYIEELIEKNEELHNYLKNSYDIISEGGNSTVYLCNNRVLKVFNLSNYIFSKNLLNFEDEYIVDSDINIFNLNEKIAKIHFESNNINKDLELFFINNVFDKSFYWASHCKYFSKKTKNLPQIFDISIDIDSCSYFIEMELLQKPQKNKQKYFEEILNLIKDSFSIFHNCDKKVNFYKLEKKLSLTTGRQKNDAELKKVLKIIKKIYKDDKLVSFFQNNTDFSTNNVLFRNQEWVITDPIN